MFLTSVLDVGELTSRSDRFTHRKKLRYPLNKRLSEPQSRFDSSGEQKILFTLPDF